MINDNAIYLQMMIVAIGVIVIMASIGIPIYAYSRKRWKGLAIGCLLQPIACAVVICLIVLGIISYFAMVTVRGLDVGNHSKDTLTWYLKDDEQCILVCNNQNDYDHLRFSDVIRLDSVSVTVDDRIVVRFDTKKNKVVATDLDTPMEVVNVNWDKVRAYFGK